MQGNGLTIKLVSLPVLSLGIGLFIIIFQGKHCNKKKTSLEDNMRKILGRKFWSLGTPLGSLGPLSQGDVIVGPYGLQILVIWGPYEPPALVACQAQAENPKSAGALCGHILFSCCK